MCRLRSSLRELEAGLSLSALCRLPYTVAGRQGIQTVRYKTLRQNVGAPEGHQLFGFGCEGRRIIIKETPLKFQIEVGGHFSITL